MRQHIELTDWDFSIPELGYSKKVTVPHTWNVDEAVMAHRGRAVYETDVTLDACKDKRVLLCFQAVYHSASVFVNGCAAGEHARSGHTPFCFDISACVSVGSNHIRVLVDNTHTEKLLPHKGDFDWADDGGITRKAELLITEPDAIAYLHAEEEFLSVDGAAGSVRLRLSTAFSDGSSKEATVRVTDRQTNETIACKTFARAADSLCIDLLHVKLWSPESPNLYNIRLETDNDAYEIRTGFRNVEVKGEHIFLNGKELYLKGCEWMPGSHPDYGMAEPLPHSLFRLKQLKDSGCIFTRFHWQQDSSLLDWCDENGLLVQEEIPYWGYPKKASPCQTEIAKQQADEMLYYHKNHPSILFWGVGNELDGASPETISYVDEMVRYFHSKDGRRLVNYVSNTVSLDANVANDDATLHGDVAMWNEYLGLWEPCGDVESHIIRTAKKCQGKPLIVTEFGLCEPYFKGGDERRCEILKERLEIYRRIANIRGYVWFSLNDYRTHVGEQGEGKLRRRIHGSTDLYGAEKPSYRLLCSLQKQTMATE